MERVDDRDDDDDEEEEDDTPLSVVHDADGRTLYWSSDLNIDDLIDRLDENEPDDDIDLANLAVDTDFRDSRGRYWVKSLRRWVAIPIDED